MPQPNLLTVPFAANAPSGNIDQIPVSLSPTDPIQAASWSVGFPGVTMTPLAAGGIPPRGQSFNGVLNAITQHLVYIGGGGQYKWQQSFATSVGYQAGSLVQKSGNNGFWLSTVDNNRTNPDSGGAGWVDANNVGLPYVVASGPANSYVANYTPSIDSLTDGFTARFKANVSNTGPSTLSANGLGARQILGQGHLPLQGGEIAANGDVWVQWNSSLGSGGAWVIIQSTGGPTQVAPAINSNQAVQVGQLPALGMIKTIKRVGLASSDAYIPSPGMVFCDVEMVGGGGGGGGTLSSASSSGAGGGGGGGAYAKKLLTAAQIGASQVVTIGAGGVGGTPGNNPGAAGGTTSLGNLLIASGGSGGGGSNASSVAGSISSFGGAGGTTATGDVSIRGGAGSPGFTFPSGGGGFSGAGANSPFGYGGYQSGPSGSGNAAVGRGAGGSGGSTGPGSSSAQGGSGAQGLVIITEYCTQ